MRTVWMLDVDGVINVDFSGEWKVALASARATAQTRTFTLQWVPQVISLVGEFAEASSPVEVRWSTTWCGDTPELNTLWNLPAIGDAFHVPPPADGNAFGWWDWHDAVREAKRASALQVIRDGDRLIWSDDQLVPGVYEDLHEELTADGRALLIKPHPAVGLQPKDLAAIREFAGGGNA